MKKEKDYPWTIHATKRDFIIKSKLHRFGCMAEKECYEHQVAVVHKYGHVEQDEAEDNARLIVDAVNMYLRSTARRRGLTKNAKQKQK